MTAISDRAIPDQALPGVWRTPLIVTATVLAWVVFGYWPTAWSMASIWARSETFAHGFLVLPIVLWLVWRQRERLAQERPAPSRAAFGLLLAAGMAWMAGTLAAANAVAQLALVAILVACVPALLGWRVTAKLAFPLGFLLFAVPFGEFLIPQLMDWTARFTVLGLHLSGVPVYRDGLDFVIPSGNWSVVEACSGIRYLIASVMVGTLFAYLNFRSLGRRLAFVAVAVAVPVVANWVRAYLIVMLGHLSGNRLATGVDHLIYGWLFFGLVVALVFLVGSRWAERPEAGAHSMPAAIVEPGPVSSPPGWGTAGVVALVATLPALAMAGIDGLNRAAPPVLDRNPEIFAAAGWRAVQDDPMQARPSFREAADSWQQTFEKDGKRVGLYIGYYRHQDDGHKLAGSARSLQPGEDSHWNWGDLGRRQVEANGGKWVVNRAELRSRGAQAPGLILAAWQWYWGAGAMTADPAMARAYSAGSRLLGRGDDGAVIVLYSPAGADSGEAALEDFGRSAGAAIVRLLDEARNRR